MKIIHEFRRVLVENRRTYLALNLAIYGVLVAMMIATPLVPGMYEVGIQRRDAFVNAPVLSVVTNAYANGSPVNAALLTFLANLIFAAIGTTTLPSLLIPFAGVVTTVWRATEIGMWFAPTPEMIGNILASLPVLLIEIQAYVLAALGSIVLWRSTFNHRRRKHPSPWAGYKAGLRDNLRLYPAIIAILIIIAAVEVLTHGLLTLWQP